jgi:hypothetical protein
MRFAGLLWSALLGMCGVASIVMKGTSVMP